MFMVGVSVGACDASGARADLADEVAQFDDYPLLWLGPSYDVDFDGTPDSITFAREEYTPPILNPATKDVLVPARRSYSISYGTCEIPQGATGCPVPLTMVFEDPCEAYPLSQAAKAGTARVRGVDAIVQAVGGLRFETADFTLTIIAVGSSPTEVADNAKRIAEDLVPANAKARSVLGARADFRPKELRTCAADPPTAGPDMEQPNPTAT